MTATAYDTADTLKLITEQSAKVRRLKPGDVLVTCPISGERTASCHVTLKADGKIIVCCFSCQRGTRDHADAWGIPMAALSPEPLRNGHRPISFGKDSDSNKRPARKPAPPKQPECLGRYPEHGIPRTGTLDKPSKGETWYVREWSPGAPVAWKVRQACVRCGARTFHWRQPDERGGTKAGKPLV